MSERLNSVDIEDVLSSIRRLVSDDQRPGAKPAAPPAPSVADPQADKLILTPALRIAPEPEPESEPEPQPAPEAGPFGALPQAAEPVEPAEPVMSFHSVRPDRRAGRLDAVMGEVARGLEPGPGEWEAPSEPPTRFESDWFSAATELADPLDLRDPVAGTAAAPEDRPLDADAAAEAPFVAVDDDYAPDAPAAPDDVAQAEPVAEMDVLPGAAIEPASMDRIEDVLVGAEVSGADLLPSWAAEDWTTEPWARSVAQASETEPRADAGWPMNDPAVDDRAMPEEETTPYVLETVALAEEPAMTETEDFANRPAATAPVAQPDDIDTWAGMEPDLSDPDVMEATTFAGQAQADPRWADAAEEEIRRELEEEATASAFARFADDDLDDRPFDEEMLRDLVRDIIREELQGALGERITRNVRKLVRAEIARALAVRDFE